MSVRINVGIPHNGQFRIWLPRMTEEQMREKADVCSSSFLVVGGIYEVVYGMMIDAREMLKKTPYFRHEVKHLVNKAISDYVKMQKETLNVMDIKEQFWLDYMDRYDELIKDPVERLIRNAANILRMQKEKFYTEKAYIVATLTLMNFAVLRYEYIIDYQLDDRFRQILTFEKMAAIRKDWGDMMEKIKIKGIKICGYKRYKQACDNIYKFLKSPEVVNKCGEYASKLNNIPKAIKVREDNE